MESPHLVDCTLASGHEHSPSSAHSPVPTAPAPSSAHSPLCLQKNEDKVEEATKTRKIQN